MAPAGIWVLGGLHGASRCGFYLFGDRGEYMVSEQEL